MPAITIPKERIKKGTSITKRNMKAWEAIRGIWRTKKLSDPVRWQRKLRREWERVLP